MQRKAEQGWAVLGVATRV